MRDNKNAKGGYDMRLSTLCYLEQDGKYLMLHRIYKKNDVNKEKWIGVGGKFEAGEAPEECLMREVLEETGYHLKSYRFRGVLTFICDVQEPEYIFLYTSDDFEGELKECDEGVLQWVDKDAVLDLNLWEGDRRMFKYLKERREPFSLKLEYEGNTLKNIQDF